MLLEALLYNLYRFNRRSLRLVILWLVTKLDGGDLCSKLKRRILKDYHEVDIGMYTHGSCFIPGNCDRYTTIGRYCSIAADARVFNRDHPMDFKSTHAYFFNPVLKCIKKDLVQYTPLRIGNDVWIGHGVIILPAVKEIGDGAVIGAGSVISKNIPPYAVAVGHPVRIVRYRFSKPTIEKLMAEKWWEKELDEIKQSFDEYTQPYETYLSAHNLMLDQDERHGTSTTDS